MLISFSGNVLIGTTTDISWAKLNVNGAIATKDYVSFYRSGERGYIGCAASGNNDIYLSSSNNLSINARGNTVINVDGGNVLMGTATDVIGKLQVEGDIYATAWIRTKGAAGWYSQDYGGGIYMTDANYVRVYNGKGFRVEGNVLIGDTTDSGSKLSIYANGASGRIKIYSSGTEGLNIGQWDGVTNRFESYGRPMLFTAYDAKPIMFGFGGDGNALTLNPNGNVLIGTTTDNGAKLQVEGDATAKVLVANKNGDGGSGAGLSLYYSKDFVNTFGIHMSQTSAYGTKGDVTGDWATYFSMTDVTSGGWIFRGIYGNVVAISNTSGNLTVTGDIISEGTIAMARLASSSDRKLKDNIAEVSAEQSMSIIKQLRPTTWSWKKDGKKSYGFIAQEVEPIVPEMVVDMEHLHLEYNQLHAFEIGAIQHIDSEVEILKRRVNELENELKQYRRV